MASQHSHIPSLDGIRAVSILIVFMAHCGFGAIIPGGFGVTIFFFLSGFLITTLLCREWDSHGRIALRAFYTRRVLRLGPPLITVLVASMILVSLGLLQGSIHLPSLLSQIFFYFNYFSIYSENATTTADGLAILWSLSVEEHFYFMWPIMFAMIAAGRFGLRGIIALLVLVLIWRCMRFFIFADTEWNIYISTDTRLDSLLYGCLLALMDWRGISKRVFPSATHAWWVIGCALLILMLTFLFRADAFRSTIRYSIQGIALMPLFYYAVNFSEMRLFRPLGWPFMRSLGLLSYSIYLLHYVVIRGLEFNGIVAQGNLLMIPLAGAISVLLAAGIYRYIEQPLHVYRRSLRPG